MAQQQPVAGAVYNLDKAATADEFDALTMSNQTHGLPAQTDSEAGRPGLVLEPATSGVVGGNIMPSPVIANINQLSRCDRQPNNCRHKPPFSPLVH